MFKNLINRGGCMVGIHQGEWNYLDADSCEQHRICTVCETEQTRTEHQMGEWRVSDDHPCTSISTCQRCASIETQVNHTWGDWVYVADGSCQAVQVCTQCNETSQDVEDYHAWGKWIYSEAYRSPIRTCARCQTQAMSFAVAAQSEPAVSGVADEIMQSIDTLNALSTQKDGEVDDEMLQAVQALTNQIVQGFQGEPVGAEPPPASNDEVDYGEMFGLLMESYQSDIDAGKLSSEQQAKFGSLLGELGPIVDSNPDDLAGMLARSGKMRELMNRLADSSDESQPHDPKTRLGKVSNYFFALDRLLKKEAGQPNWSSTEQEELANLFGRMVQAKNQLVGLNTDAEAYAHERQNLRQVAYDIRQYFARHHLSIAYPIWASTPLPVNPNQIYFAGQTEQRSLVATICQQNHLDLLAEPRQKDPAQARWDNLCACHIAIFDLTTYDRQRETELEITTQVGVVVYDMGIAFALGKPMLVLARAGQNLPFDIDIEPVVLAGQDDEVVLAQALDDTLYSLQRGSAESSVRETATYLQNRFGERTDSYIKIMFEQLTDEVLRDAMRTRRILSQVLSLLGDEAPQLITPTFPMSYAEDTTLRCFHVTAFRDWAERSSAILEAACQSSGAVYRRGDQALDPDIVRSIWDEICLATHIVVDLTYLNANAVLEMGMAHTLGRKVYAITQDTDIHHYFRSIAKLRVHQYEVGNAQSEETLTAKLQAFLQS